MTAGFSVRRAGAGDVAGIQRVSATTGQPEIDSGADEAYVALVLRTGTALVAVDGDDAVLGWGAAREHPLGTMISDLFVSPDNQGLGIGRALLAELRRTLDSARWFTFSSRHASALPVYARAGLVPCWPLTYLSGPNPGRSSGLVAEHVDADTAVSADAELTGVRRDADYDFWLRLPKSAAVVLRIGSRVVASGAVRADAVLHLCCPSPDDAGAALTAAFEACGTDRVSACLPGCHPAFGTLLRSGFRITDYDIAMTTPDLGLPSSWAYSPGLG